MDDVEREAIYNWLKGDRRLALPPRQNVTDEKLLSALWQETRELVDDLERLGTFNG
jgi:hypothetical protein